MKYKFFIALTYGIGIFIIFKAMEKDNAPDWALHLEVLIGTGIFLILINQAIAFIEKD